MKYLYCRYYLPRDSSVHFFSTQADENENTKIDSRRLLSTNGRFEEFGVFVFCTIVNNIKAYLK